MGACDDLKSTCCCCCIESQSYSVMTDSFSGVVTQQPQRRSDYGAARTTGESEHLRKFNEQLKQKNDILEKQNKYLEIQQKKYKTENDALNVEIDDLRLRLSKAMSVAITDNNPAVADLSDGNRPTKLCDRYAELYDNQYTDLFETLTTTFMSDTEAIVIILNLFKMIYTVCKDRATNDLQSLQEHLKGFVGKHAEKAQLKQLKESRKKNYAEEIERMKSDSSTMDRIRSILKDTVGEEAVMEQTVTAFQDISLELCWLMAIQDPPVCVVDHKDIRGQLFDQGAYRAYTKSGKYVDYVVWSPMRLYEGGSLLFKGVAQGTDQQDTE